MNSLPLAEAAVLSPFVTYFEEGGAQPNRHLDRCGISRETVERSAGKITKFQLYRYLKESASREGIPDLGYRIGESHGIGYLGALSRALLQAATLKDAIDTFTVLLNGWMGENQLWLEPDRDPAFTWLYNASADGLEDHNEISNQCGVMTLIALVRCATGPDWRPDRIRIGVQPSGLHGRFEALAEAKIGYTSDQTGFRFPTRFLSAPVRGTGGEASADPVPSPGPLNLADALEQTLLHQAPYRGVPQIAAAAEMSGTSVRSLQRQLAVEGLTYRRLLDRVRFGCAVDLMRQNPSLTVQDLAAELDYATPSGFVRAFHRVAGTTPGEYRKRDM